MTAIFFESDYPVDMQIWIGSAKLQPLSKLRQICKWLNKNKVKPDGAITVCRLLLTPTTEDDA